MWDQVHDFLTNAVLLGGEIAGFASWSPARRALPGEDKVHVQTVPIAYFGIASHLRSARDGTGRKASDLLLDSVLQEATQSSIEVEDPTVHLYCHRANTFGRSFWERRKFIDYDKYDGDYIWFARRLGELPLVCS